MSDPDAHPRDLAGGHIRAVRRVGDHALLVSVDDSDAVAAFDATARAMRDAGELDAVDIVPAASTVLLDGCAHPDRVASALSSWPWREAAAAHHVLVTVEVSFDGPDLEEVARQWAMDAGAVVERVVGTQFRVDFCGFAPGFGYMSGMPREWAVTRRTQPRTVVPAGAFALAGAFAGIYPRPSPGGWQILGTAIGITLWDVHRDPPALLTPGTRVRVRRAS